MKRQQTMRRLPLYLSLLGLVFVGVVLHRQVREENDGFTSSAPGLESAQSFARPSAPTGGGKASAAPRLALSLLELSRKSESAAGEKEAGTKRMERERFYADERQIMAKTWGLNMEQAADFEIVVRDGHEERRAVFDRLTRESISSMEVAAELTAAEERTKKRLLEVLGADRLLEYELTYGHFVEMGLDRNPFVPPTPVTVAPAVGQPEDMASPSQTAPSVPL